MVRPRFRGLEIDDELKLGRESCTGSSPCFAPFEIDVRRRPPVGVGQIDAVRHEAAGRREHAVRIEAPLPLARRRRRRRASSLPAQR
jgi:hypothetical protein